MAGSDQVRVRGRGRSGRGRQTRPVFTGRPKITIMNAMNERSRKLASQIFRMRGRKKSVVLLLWANWVLVGVSWGMSVQTYLRLPGRMALWLSVWRETPVIVDRSWVFFIYPLIQTVVFLGGMAVAGRFFISRSDSEDIANLKAEVSYVELIFVSILFIHLQTSLIFISFGMGRGINQSYLGVIIAVLIMLVPYYHIRRRVLSR